MTEWWRKGALELAAAIRNREVAAAEVVEAHLDRIDEANGINAVVRVLRDTALAQAAVVDQAAERGDSLGPFAGVPITVKENIDVKGCPTTWGSYRLRNAVASTDAPDVERFKAAGAIVIGRTNLPDMALRADTTSSAHGRTGNPWDPERTAGGSTGGGAAALAVGMTPLELGNDVGGSARGPAGACGVAGMKPSQGVVPWASQNRPQDLSLAFQWMASQGLLARRVADLRAGLEVIAGAHPRDPLSVPAQLSEPNPDERVRVAVMLDPPGGRTHPGIVAGVRAAADALANLGHDVVEVTPPEFKRAIALWGELIATDLRGGYKQFKGLMGRDGQAFLEGCFGVWPKLDLSTFLQRQQDRFACGREFAQWFVDHPILLSPSWTQPAFAAGFDLSFPAKTLQLMRPLLPANLLGMPSVVVPGGLVEGLPFGVQIMGSRFSDLRCLAVAAELEAQLGTLTPINPRNSPAKPPSRTLWQRLGLA